MEMNVKITMYFFHRVLKNRSKEQIEAYLAVEKTKV